MQKEIFWTGTGILVFSLIAFAVTVSAMKYFWLIFAMIGLGIAIVGWIEKVEKVKPKSVARKRRM